MAAKETITVTFDVSKLVKAASREAFKNVPRPKRIGDKRRKAPRFGHKLED